MQNSKELVEEETALFRPFVAMHTFVILRFQLEESSFSFQFSRGESWQVGWEGCIEGLFRLTRLVFSNRI